MSLQQASCSYRGAVFTGAFQVIGDGAERAVRVRYHGESLEARTGDAAPEAIAVALLEELVVLETISLTVRAATHH